VRHGRLRVVCVMAFGAIMPITAACSPEAELLDTATSQEQVDEVPVDEASTPDANQTEPGLPEEWNGADAAGPPEGSLTDDPTSLTDDPTSLEPTRYDPVTNPAALDVVVNKGRPLPADYVPQNLVKPDIPRRGAHTLLRQDAATALEEMNAAAKEEVGKPLQLVSGYRSYAEQEKTYDRYVRKDGVEHADTYSARAGYSEHQTGLAVDLSVVRGKIEKFGRTELGEWTAANSWRFGYIMRYTDQNEPETGYQSEPWHYRFIGKELAAQYHDVGASSLEEFLGAPPAPAYYEPSAATPIVDEQQD